MFGHGLCAWRYLNPALNPWSALWMLRIGDRLPSTRSISNRPTVMHLVGSKTPFAGHSINNLAVMGLTATAEVLEDSKIRSQCGCLTLQCCAHRATPQLRVLRSKTNLLRPCRAPPVSGVVGVAMPCSTTLEVGCVVPTKLVGVSGALVSSVACWAQVALGIVPQSVQCAAGGGAAVR